MTSTEGKSILYKVLTASSGNVVTNGYMFCMEIEVPSDDNSWYEMSIEDAKVAEAKVRAEEDARAEEARANSPEAQLEALYALIMDETSIENGEN